MIYVCTSFEGKPFEGVCVKSENGVMWIASPVGILKMVEGKPQSILNLSKADEEGINPLDVNKALRYIQSRIAGIERDRIKGLMTH